MRDYKLGDEPVPGYQIIRPLGAGGYGTVWVAKSPGDVEIALKIINLQGQGLKEFRAISLVKRLRHPNLIPIYAFWLKDEYGNFLDSTAQDSVNLRGRQSELIIAYGLGDKSLAQRLDECKQAFAQRHGLPDTDAPLIAKLQDLQGTDLAGLPAEELLDYMFGAAKAIDYLNQPTHNLGTGPPAAIQHCDIKPGNLLIVSNDVQVCDYGLARVADDARKTQAAGTPAYMAPELFANKPSNGTDQYSLAITFYELRTGRLPFEESVAFHAHIMGQLDFGLVTPTEQEILRRATHMRPDQRYPHSIEMVRALREAITPTRLPTPLSSPIIGSSAQHQPLPVSSDSKIQRGEGSGPPVPASSSSTPTVFTKVTVLDDLIRAGVELVPGHRLDALLGRGGYGEVWSATMPGKTKCALKIVRNLDAVQGRQELKSLDMIRDLDHDRLIRLQSYWLLAHDGSVIPDEEIGQPGAPKASGLVVATDLAQQNLLQRWQECYDQGQSGIPVAELVPYVRQSAEAIDHLNFHEPAIIHRDIKPENILLTKNKQVKVSDFGLAKLVEGTNAAIGSASVGMTLAYAAPEMFRNTVTKWTDQYSLAITYYRLRTGRLPFEDGMGPIQMMQAHTSGMLDFSGVGPAEQAVLKRSCALEPEARFGSCLEFADALGIAAGISRPVVSTPSMPQTHPVSSPLVGAGSGPGRRGGSVMEPTSKFPNLPGMSDSSSNIRETIRFEDLKSSTPPVGGWPPPPERPVQKDSSGEFHLPDVRRGLPDGPPVGLMETVTKLPSAADVDTDPDGTPRPRWQEGGADGRPTGGGSKLAIAAAVAVLVAGGGGVAYWLTHRDAGQTTSTSQVAMASTKVTETSEPRRNGNQGSAKTVPTAKEPNPAPNGATGIEQKRPLPPTPPPTDDKKIQETFDAALKSLKPDQWKSALKPLESIEKMQSSPGNETPGRAKALKRQLDKLANVERTEAGVLQLANDIPRYPDTFNKSDVEPLTEVSRYELGKAIADAVPTLSEGSRWNELLNACRLALPVAAEPTSSYIVGCEAESAAEMLAKELSPSSGLDDIYTALASRNGSDPTHGYLTYAKARLAWEKAKTDTAAAGQILAIYTGPDKLAGALVATHRKLGAAHVLEGAARQLRASPTNPLKPFSQDKEAKQAVGWLKMARTLHGELSTEDKLTLALAAGQAGDKATAREVLAAFASPDVLSRLSVPDAAAMLRVRANVQDEATVAGQKAQTESLTNIIKLRGDHPQEVSVGFVNQVVLQPLLNADTAHPFLAGAEVDRAKLYTDAARMIQNDSSNWEGVLGKEADLWACVRRLYDRAEALDGRAEYIVRKAFASLQGERGGTNGKLIASLLPLADQAIKKDPGYPGGYVLKGRLLHFQATLEPDRYRQLKLLRDAATSFEEAESHGVATAGVDDLRWFYLSRSTVCLLLGNYSKQPEERAKGFTAAVKYAEALTKKYPKYLDAWIALGNADEDVAYFLHDTSKFESACGAFDAAERLAIQPSESRPWLGRGRCKYRWAEVTSPERQAEAVQRLNDADADLSKAVERLNQAPVWDAVAACEAHFFLGLSHALRSKFVWDAGANADNTAKSAATEFAAAAKLATDDLLAGRSWGRFIAVARCELEPNWATSIFGADRSKAIEHYRRGRELTEEIRKYSDAAAALEKAKIIESEAELTGFTEEISASLVDTYKSVADNSSSDDLDERFEIAKRLGRLFASGKLQGGANWDGAYTYMVKAADLARQAGRGATEQAERLIEAGDFRRLGSDATKDKSKKRQYIEDFAEQTRKAIELTPEHQYVWFWKMNVAFQYVSRIKDLRDASADVADERLTEIRILEETARYYREVDKAMPGQFRGQYQRDVTASRAKVEAQAKESMPNAIEDYSKQPDVWKWRWTLAEILANDKSAGSAEAARKQIAIAAATMPTTEPKQVRESVLDLNRRLERN